MTAYNREGYIAEAIESVLASSYDNFELIVVDDGSTDRTVPIVRSFEETDPRVKLHVNEKNLGQFPNRNYTATFASGEFIFWVDSDDTIFSDSITNLVEAMHAFPSAEFGMYAPTLTELTLVQPQQAINDHFFKEPFLLHGPGGTIIRKDFFNRIGKYPVEYGIPGDMYFNLKAASQTPVLLIPFAFMKYRIHPGQELNNSYDYLYNNYKYMHDALALLPLGLEPAKIKWLDKKNKRRFTVNIFKYFFSTMNVGKTYNAVKQAHFSFGDMLEGIFHIDVKHQPSPDHKKPAIAQLNHVVSHLVHKVPSRRFYKLYSKRINRSNAGMIVSLHSVRNRSGDDRPRLNNFIEIDSVKLEEILISLKSIGAKFVSLKEIEQSLNSGKFSSPVVHFSFDDGYRDNYTIAYPIFKKYQVPFSVFLVSDFIDSDQPFLWWYIIEHIILNKMPVAFEKYNVSITAADYDRAAPADLFRNLRELILQHGDKDRQYFTDRLNHFVPDIQRILPEMLQWQQVNEMLSSGLCEIGVHTKTHARFASLTDPQRISEIKFCKNMITERTGTVPEYFAYSYGGPNDLGDTSRLEQVMSECGMKLALTTIPGELNSGSCRYMLPRIFLNNAATDFTLKTRLNGAYQRRIAANKI